MKRPTSDTEPTGILVSPTTGDTLPGSRRTMTNDTDPTWPPSAGVTEPDGRALSLPLDDSATEPEQGSIGDGDDVLVNGIRRHRAPPKINPRILAVSDGDTAAAYYAAPREPNTRFDTPPPEPAVEVFVTSPMAPVVAPPAEAPIASTPDARVDSHEGGAARALETFVIRPKPPGGRWMMVAIVGLGVVVACLILTLGRGDDPRGQVTAAPASAPTVREPTGVPSATPSSLAAEPGPTSSPSPATPSPTGERSTPMSASAPPVAAQGTGAPPARPATSANSGHAQRPSSDPVSASATPRSPALPTAPSPSATDRRPDLSTIQ